MSSSTTSFGRILAGLAAPTSTIRPLLVLHGMCWAGLCRQQRLLQQPRWRRRLQSAPALLQALLRMLLQWRGRRPLQAHLPLAAQQRQLLLQLRRAMQQPRRATSRCWSTDYKAALRRSRSRSWPRVLGLCAPQPGRATSARSCSRPWAVQVTQQRLSGSWPFGLSWRGRVTSGHRLGLCLVVWLSQCWREWFVDLLCAGAI